LEEVLVRVSQVASAFMVALLTTSVEAQVRLPSDDSAQRPLEVQRETPPNLVAQLSGATVDKPQAAAAGGWYFDLSGEGSYLSGRKNFIFGTEQGSLTPSGFPTVKEFSFNLNGPGAGGSAAVGYWLTQTLGLELSLSGTQQNLSDQQNCSTSSGLQPVIRGQTAASGMINFDCVEVTGQQFQERFSYSQRFLDSHLDVRLRVWESPDRRTALEMVGGVAYTNVYQSFNVSVCCEAADGTSARLNTEINVTDNLVGGRLGLRGNHGFGGGLRVFGSLMTDLYQRLSNLNSTQNATSICYDGGPCRQTFRLNQYASQNHFVPRAEVALGAAVDIVENWSIGLFFKFDGLWNMSRPDVPRFNGTAPLGGATQANKSQLGLSGDDQIQVYSWGLVFAGRF
jgi:hypothetical protein